MVGKDKARVMVTLPKELLERIDKLAADYQLTRSDVVRLVLAGKLILT